MANEWFETQRPRWSEGYAERLRERLDGDLVPVLGDRVLGSITPIEVLDAIRMIEARDALEMAKRVMQMASAIFRYGVATSRCERDPTADVRGALKAAKPVKHRTALPAKETGIDSGKLTWVDECWLKISVRPQEAARYLDTFAEPELARRLKAGLEPGEAYTIEVEEPF